MTASHAITPLRAGRALHVGAGGVWYIGQHYEIHESRDHGRSWRHVASIPRSIKRRVAECSRLACRLLRHEVKALATLSDGALIAATREGVYYSTPGELTMATSRIEAAGQRVAPPMTLTVGPNDRILWGEYNSRTAHGIPMRIYVSDDRGRSFQVAHTFEGGSILHLHNLHFDVKLRHYWVLAGDHHHEPGIGRLSEDLRKFEWVAKGEQRFRAVQAFDFGDSLIYGMDTEREPNAVIRFDKASGRTERLQELDGSCIYGCRFGGVYALSTSIEPSTVNLSREAGLWLSRDGERWTRVYSAVKDRWHPKYFQFGSIVLPRGETDDETVFFSGQALAGIDGRVFELNP